MLNLDHLQVQWNYPTSIRFGVGAAGQLAELCRNLGVHRPLLVTDVGLAKLPIVGNVMEQLVAADLRCVLFSQIKPNPTVDNVDAGVMAYRQGGHDGVIALGGGSALDAAKAIALMVGQSRVLWDFEDIGDNWRRVNKSGIAPCIAVPTTAGTGSEVGRASVIMDERASKKRIIFHPDMVPDMVVLDPELVRDLPKAITAATGMDALSHSLEAYCAPGFHPMADGIAIEAMRMIKDWLPIAFEDGDDLHARGQMLVASTMGATAFQKGLGAMHALAHPFGALYDVHHGLLNAILMPYVIHANRNVIEGPLARLSQCLSIKDQSVDGFLAWVLALRKTLQIPHSLSEIAIDEYHIDLVAEMAVEDPSAATNPIAFSAEAYKTIASQAIRGQLS